MIKYESQIELSVEKETFKLGDSYLSVESCVGYFMEAFFEDGLVVFGAGELEQDSSCGFCQTEASFEVHLLADHRCSIH